MKKGFTLIEIMIGIVIAGMLSAGLFNTITQVGSVQQTISGLTSIYGRLAIFQQQIERDLMGAFVPMQYDVLPTQTGQKPSEHKPLEKIFYAESKGKGGRLDYLTFITTNPLEVYSGVKNVKLKPRVARVVYRLVPDPKNKLWFLLQRQEGTSHLSFEKYAKDAQGDFRAFTMIDGIRDISVQFISIEQKEDKESKKITYTYKRQPNWDSFVKDVAGQGSKESTVKGAQQPKERPWPKLPNQVEFTISLWDANKSYKTFTMTIPIESMVGNFAQEEKKKDAEDTSQAEQNASVDNKNETAEEKK